MEKEKPDPELDPAVCYIGLITQSSKVPPKESSQENLYFNTERFKGNSEILSLTYNSVFSETITWIVTTTRSYTINSLFKTNPEGHTNVHYQQTYHLLCHDLHPDCQANQLWRSGNYQISVHTV